MSAKSLSGQEIEGRYFVKSKLGSGGMGTVYLAADKQQGGKDVALKLIRHELCRDSKMRRRFVKESQIFSYLSHPHIVKVEHFGQTSEEQLYMVMEYIPSVSLQDLRSLTLPYSLIVNIMVQLLEALSHSHLRGIIHRDLKPANVLLSPLGNGTIFVKLVDFGIASLPSFAKGGEEFTRTVLGTPYYMAPEQSRGNVSQIGPGTDIYSIGVMLYELLCGKVPYKGSVDIETILMHIEEPIPELKLRDAMHAPKEIEGIVRKAMAKKTWDRYVGANELSKALQETKYNKEEPIAQILDEIKLRMATQSSGVDSSSDEYEAPTRNSVQFQSRQISFPESIQLKSREISDRSENRARSNSSGEHKEVPAFFTMPSSDSGAAMSSFDSSSSASSPSQSSGAATSFSAAHSMASYNSNLHSLQSDSHPSLKATLNTQGAILGRDIELATISEMCLSSIEGKGNIVVVEGEWGMGKSLIARQGVERFASNHVV